MAEARLKGEPVQLGGETYVLPPLGFLGLRTMLPKISQIAVREDGTAVTDSAAQMDLLLEVAHAALQRNYPELSFAQFQQVLDVSDVTPLVQAVMRQNKFTAVAEKNAPAAVSPSPGRASTGDSSPPLDGVGSTSTNA